MALDVFQNTFAGNPLDRASERRGDTAWLTEKINAPDSLGIALWNGKPLVEKKPDEKHTTPVEQEKIVAGEK